VGRGRPLVVQRPARTVFFYCRKWKSGSALSYGKGKGKLVHPRTVHEGPEAKLRYTPTLYLTSALDGVGGQRYAPAALSQGKTRYSLYTALGGPQSRPGQVLKISPPSGFDPQTVQPLEIRYTGYATE